MTGGFLLRDADNRQIPENFLRPSWKGLVVLCVLAAFLTFTGVYDAVKALPIWWGWAYWMLTLVVGCLVGYGTISGLHQLRASVAAQYSAALLTSTAAVTAVIIALQFQNIPEFSFKLVPPLFLQVFVISMTVFVIGIMLDRAFGTSTNLPGSLSNPVKHFLEHLPMKYRDAELYAISSEDHYLRVYTSEGEELILMRLSDAVHALRDADGLQTHRSWWVGKAGISEVKRDNGKVEILLKSGTLAPVSRTYQPAIKDANWF